MLKDQVIKLRDEAKKDMSRNKDIPESEAYFDGKRYAYDDVLDLITQEPDCRPILEDCLAMALAFRDILKPGVTYDRIDQHIKKLEEVLQ